MNAGPVQADKARHEGVMKLIRGGNGKTCLTKQEEFKEQKRDDKNCHPNKLANDVAQKVGNFLDRNPRGSTIQEQGNQASAALDDLYISMLKLQLFGVPDKTFRRKEVLCRSVFSGGCGVALITGSFLLGSKSVNKAYEEVSWLSIPMMLIGVSSVYSGVRGFCRAAGSSQQGPTMDRRLLEQIANSIMDLDEIVCRAEDEGTMRYISSKLLITQSDIGDSPLDRPGNSSTGNNNPLEMISKIGGGNIIVPLLLVAVGVTIYEKTQNNSNILSALGLIFEVMGAYLFAPVAGKEKQLDSIGNQNKELNDRLTLTLLNPNQRNLFVGDPYISYDDRSTGFNQAIHEVDKTVNELIANHNDPTSGQLLIQALRAFVIRKINAEETFDAENYYVKNILNQMTEKTLPSGSLAVVPRTNSGDGSSSDNDY